ncbi:hypothetical protein, partial [uncultured Helicobacter sp.]|uniref:hypothetical protein n=1 Tax=uncultured Helicobacter sp. TaxID=175537 RepID=UPI002636E728
MNKKDFDAKLKSLGISRQDFCDMTGLAYSSVANWKDERKPIPIWVDSWLDNYAKAKTLDDVSKARKPYLKDE